MIDIAKRLLSLVIVLVIVTFVTFVLIDFLPGDPAVALIGESATPEQVENVRAQLGLDDPLPQRYVNWLGDVLTGDLGRSFRTGQSVSEALAQRVPVSLELMALSMIFSLVLASTW